MVFGTTLPFSGAVFKLGRRIFESNHAARGDAGCLNRLASVALCLTADDERATAGADSSLFQGGVPVDGQFHSGRFTRHDNTQALAPPIY